jgi:acetoin utilization deacetylase AcuC-like enzyme
VRFEAQIHREHDAICHPETHIKTAMLTVYSPAHLAHAPAKEFLNGNLVDVFESPRRAENILEAVRQARLGEIIAPKDFGIAPIRVVHDADYIEFLQTAHAQWIADGQLTDTVYPDTFLKPGFMHRPTRIGAVAGIYAMDLSAPIVSGTWHAAYQSAMCALTATEIARGDERAAFALCRPPGHHAHANTCGGYCYLNNAAIAAQLLISQGASTVCILDLDVHHGNGTQNIFYSRDDVLFVSLHGHPDWEYPYFFGGEDEIGEGKGKGFNLNFPLAKRTNTETYLLVLQQALARIANFAPSVLIVSLGVDTYEKDPLSQIALTTEAFPQIGRNIAQLNLPTVFIMEGGYAIDDLGKNVVGVLCGFETKR